MHVVKVYTPPQHLFPTGQRVLEMGSGYCE